MNKTNFRLWSAGNNKHSWMFLLMVNFLVIAFVMNQIPNSFVNIAQAQAVATLAVSPTSGTNNLNQNFTVNINLNTSGNPADGVDVYSLHFNPAILQVVDSNGGVAGVQIAPGVLLPNTAINTVNNSTGLIQFSQSTTGGSSFTGSGTIATITFIGIANGTSAVTFDFTPGSTSDSNVAYQGNDVLGSVTNGSYTIVTPDTTAPTVSITAPTAGATVSGTSTTVSATASDNVGVAGVTFRIDGVNLGAEDTASPYTTTWNTTTASNATHSITAVARDAAGNTTTSSAISVTVNNPVFDFSISNGGARTVTQGSNITNSVSTTLTSGTTQAVTFTASGLPSGVSAAFSPTSCSPTCTATLTLTATGAATVGTTTTTITGTAGSTVRTSTFALTVNASTYLRTINIASLEGRTSRVITGSLAVLSNPSKTLLRTHTFTTDSSGNAAITFDVSPQTVFLRVGATPFLTRLLTGIDLNSNTPYTFPQLFTGDINGDNIINSVDYSVLNTSWFTSSAASDLNQDGLVNSIDYSYMNRHWLVNGEI